MISIKELQAGVQLPQLGIKTLLRQQAPYGGRAPLMRIVSVTLALSPLVVVVKRAIACVTIALGLRPACACDLAPLYPVHEMDFYKRKILFDKQHKTKQNF